MNPDRKHLYYVGGVSALLLGALYVIITVLYVLGGALAGGAEEWLMHLAGHTNEWWAILYLSVFTDLLFLPVAWALYAALREANRTAVLTGASLIVLFVVLDLAVTWPNYASLISLGGVYSSAASDAVRTAIVTVARYPFEILSSTLFGVYAILVPSLGILAIGAVMLKDAFYRITGYLGVATGVFGIVSVIGALFVPSLGMAAVLTSVLTLVWLLFAGWDLLKLQARVTA